MSPGDGEAQARLRHLASITPALARVDRDEAEEAEATAGACYAAAIREGRPLQKRHLIACGRAFCRIAEAFRTVAEAREALGEALAALREPE